MIINVTAKGTTIKPSFHEVLETKLEKFERFFEDGARAEVLVSNEGGRETVEVTIHSGGMVYRSEATTRDRLDSLDMVVDTLFRQIVKNRSKLQSKFRKQAFDTGYAEGFNVGTVEEDEDEDGGDYNIVRSKQFTLKPMFVEEAILQMNMLGHSFFVFLNADTNSVCVIYKRKDGNYGLIEPEFD